MQMQNYWVYAIFVIAFICAIQYIANSCINKSFGNILVIIGYLILAYIVFSSMRWNNSWADKKNESSSQKMLKNTVDTFFAIVIIILIYCRLVK